MALQLSIQPLVAIFIVFFHKTLFSLNKPLIIETKSSSVPLIKKYFFVCFITETQIQPVAWAERPHWLPVDPPCCPTPSCHPLFLSSAEFFCILQLHLLTKRYISVCAWIVSCELFPLFFSQGRKNKHFLDGVRLFICHY